MYNAKSNKWRRIQVFVQKMRKENKGRDSNVVNKMFVSGCFSVRGWYWWRDVVIVVNIEYKCQ